VRRHLPQHLLTALLFSATGLSAADETNWLDNTIATCQQEFNADSCGDPEFLEEHYHVRSLQAAHKASMRSRLEEQKALRELSLQHLCGHSPKKYCEGDATGDCIAQIQQMCLDISQRAAQCVAQAEPLCASNTAGDCLARQTAYCPSAKKQPIGALLAKYPKLSPAQKNRLVQVAEQLDQKDRSLIGQLFQWLGF